uniref:Uncharacterized protein n=1 Tax=uncultured marine virus TaxID=186617 RepID=A0A0F7L3D2_9VIRU|nr:hypothetical protein [uncultured marine virus]
MGVRAFIAAAQRFHTSHVGKFWPPSQFETQPVRPPDALGNAAAKSRRVIPALIRSCAKNAAAGLRSSPLAALAISEPAQESGAHSSRW